VKRAPRNRTLEVTPDEAYEYRRQLRCLAGPVTTQDVIDSVIHDDLFRVLDWLPSASVDLLFADPPYNLTKTFNGRKFSAMSSDEYELWLESWIPGLRRLLKPSASLYVCGDWRSSTAIQRVLERYFVVRNRITWEREKGRGALSNWKNCSEDIWFASVSDEYVFHAEAVRLQRTVVAPYTHSDGRPKDWLATDEGRFRVTFPSNLWTDITIPFWSMPENTDHPTQKPEKLLAKLILASTNERAVILDPFLGSGTTAVVARKLGRHFIAVEIDEEYCLLAMKRLRLAENNKEIQGYFGGVFWERNTLAQRLRGGAVHARTHLVNGETDASLFRFNQSGESE